MIYWISLLPVSISYIMHIAYGDQVQKFLIISSDQIKEGIPIKLYNENDLGTVNVLIYKPQDYKSKKPEYNFNNPYQDQHFNGNQKNKIKSSLQPNKKISYFNSNSAFSKEDCIPAYEKPLNIFEIYKNGSIIANELKQKNTQYYMVPVPKEHLRNRLVEFAKIIINKIRKLKEKETKKSSSHNEQHKATTHFYVEDQVVSVATNFSSPDTLSEGINSNSGLAVCADSTEENWFAAKPLRAGADKFFNSRRTQNLLQDIRAEDLFNTLCALKIVCIVNLNATPKKYDGSDMIGTMNYFQYFNGFDTMYGGMSPVKVIIIMDGLTALKLSKLLNAIDISTVFDSSNNIVKPLEVLGRPNLAPNLYAKKHFSDGDRLIPKGRWNTAGSFTAYGGLNRKGILNNGKSFNDVNKWRTVNYFSRQTPLPILSHGNYNNRDFSFRKDYVRPSSISNAGVEFNPRVSLHTKVSVNSGGSENSPGLPDYLIDTGKMSVVGDSSGLLSAGLSYLTEKPRISKDSLNFGSSLNTRWPLISKGRFYANGLDHKKRMISSFGSSGRGHLSLKSLLAENSFNTAGGKKNIVSSGTLNDTIVLSIPGGSSGFLSSGGGYDIGKPVFSEGSRSAGSSLNAGRQLSALNNLSTIARFGPDKGFQPGEDLSSKSGTVSEGTLNVTGGLNTSDIVSSSASSNVSEGPSLSVKDNMSDVVGGSNSSTIVSTGDSSDSLGAVTSAPTDNMSVEDSLYTVKGWNASDVVSSENNINQSEGASVAAQDNTTAASSLSD